VGSVRLGERHRGRHALLSVILAACVAAVWVWFRG
jgi:hypothetical protein